MMFNDVIEENMQLKEEKQKLQNEMCAVSKNMNFIEQKIPRKR